MHLGDIYIKTFFLISAVAFGIAIASSFLLRSWKRINAGWLFALSLVVGLSLAYAGNSQFHRDIFVRWQQSQNKWVPQKGCLTYEPSFGRLYATYSMSRDEFERWTASYPAEMSPYDMSFLVHDSERLGFSDPEVAYATEMAPNGNQLRVYFKDGVMYLSYNAM